MNFANRISALQPSLTIALNTKARSLRAQGEQLYNLAAGEPNFIAPAPVVEAAQHQLSTGDIRYSAAGGTIEFREAIVDKYRRENNLDYQNDEVVVGCGSKELLLHAFLATLNAGDQVILAAPYWLTYREQIKLCQAEPIVVPFDPQSPGLSPKQLEQYATTKTRAVVINYPNNPSGYLMSRDELQELGNYLQDKDWWLFSDEIYEYLLFDGSKHLSIVNVCPELRDRTVIFNGLSKGFAMTGWRVGYALGHKDLIGQIRKLQSHSTTCLPSFIEKAAIVAVQQGRQLVQQEIATIADKRRKFLALLEKLDSLSFTSPNGAFYVLVKLPEHITSALSFSEWLLDNYRVMVVPSEAFGVDGCLRLSYTAPEQEVREGVKLLAKALVDYPRQGASH